MKILLIFCLALIGSMISAQSVIVKATGAGAVRGKATTNVSSVLTNLSVTGTLDPDVTGTYVQVEDYWEGYRQWSNNVTHFVIAPLGDAQAVAYYIYPKASPYTPNWQQDVRVEKNPTGAYSAFQESTGTATVDYWYQTNYSSSASVTMQGTATP